jgi:hypothetical protein
LRDAVYKWRIATSAHALQHPQQRRNKEVSLQRMELADATIVASCFVDFVMILSE